MSKELSAIKLPPLDHQPKSWHERKPVVAARIAAGVAAAAMSLVSADSLATRVIEPQVASSITRISSEEQCQKSSHVTVVESSTGLPISHYAANNLAPLVESYNGCILAQAYGSQYNPAELSQDIIDTTRQFTPEGRQKDLVLIGLSFGGIAVQDVANKITSEGADHLNIKALVLESVPSGPSSVRGEGSQMLLELSKNNIHLGKAALFLVNSYSILIDQGRDPRDKTTIEDLLIVTKNTSPSLIGDQLSHIANSYPPSTVDAPVYYIGSSHDKTVDIATAIEQINQQLKSPLVFVPLVIPNSDGTYDHAGSWIQIAYGNYYEKIYRQVFARLYPSDREHGGSLANTTNQIR